jgi:hypothetical protein
MQKKNKISVYDEFCMITKMLPNILLLTSNWLMIEIIIEKAIAVKRPLVPIRKSYF